MNAVEIEEAVSALAEQPFDAATFPFAFLEAFGNKATTIKRLRQGASNRSDLGGVLQTNNIHIKVCPEGEVSKALTDLKESPATAKAKAKFVLATDGIDFEAEDLIGGETVACGYAEFPDHFGFFLPLAGITTVKQVRESAFDIKATGRLNKLYIELLRNNPEWGAADRRPDMNHFMARLIFCFFAEDTDIFHGDNLFTATIEQMSARDSSNTHEVISELFRAMNTKTEDRAKANFPRWANAFPYVNGGLFSNRADVPHFSRIGRSYLLHIGNLDWKMINPDIFGSMIQAVADDDERGALGMHYTSVPNILKVLNPLAYVANVGEEFVTQYERRDSRLRVIYDNGTESDVLLRSLQRALHRDDAGRRITEPAAGPLFSDDRNDGDEASGTIYVLRSKSDHPLVSENRQIVHKIGVTSGDVERRIANAKIDPTFLMAEVEVVATYELYNINRTKLENLVHRIFDPARLDIEIKDRFGNPVSPREWFLVPLAAIDDAVDKIKDGTIAGHQYDPQEARLKRRAPA